MTTPRAQEIIDAALAAPEFIAQHERSVRAFAEGKRPIPMRELMADCGIPACATVTVWAADPTFTAQRYHRVRREQTADGPSVLAAVAWCGYRPRISAWRPWLARGGETAPERDQRCPVCADTPPARGSRPGVCGAR